MHITSSMESNSDARWMLYQLHQLPPGSNTIRVLDVLPAPNTAARPDEQPISCSLRVISLDDRPNFTALSYVWGTYSPVPDFIACDGVQIIVTSNCYSALRHLRRKLGTFTIWLDAVCIFQENLEEKSQQIPLMGSIYSLAQCVYVWLGEGSPETDRAMAYMANAWFERYYRVTESGRTASHPHAAAWFAFIARWSTKHHPMPFRGSI
jgi:hypothetical protein